jgi:hypothetical protein
METFNDLFFGASIGIREGYRVNISLFLFSFFHKAIFHKWFLQFSDELQIKDSYLSHLSN